MLGQVNAVDLTDPLGFTAYLGIAFLLYAIRETKIFPNRYIPLISVVLGLIYASIQFGDFNESSIIAGLRLALLGVGSVATIKYLLDKVSNDDDDLPPGVDRDPKSGKFVSEDDK